MLQGENCHPRLSLTENYAPRYRKALGLIRQDPEVTISTNYQAINQIINQLQGIFNERMDIHEQELVTVMKMEMHRLLEDLHEVVKGFNKVIREKDMDQNLLQAENEIDYFKFEALRLFQENKKLKNEVSELREQSKKLREQISLQNDTMVAMGRKIIKQKTRHNLSLQKMKLVEEQPSLDRQNSQTLRFQHKKILLNDLKTIQQPIELKTINDECEQIRTRLQTEIRKPTNKVMPFWNKSGKTTHVQLPNSKGLGKKLRGARLFHRREFSQG